MTFISFLPQSWQSWVLLLACILSIGFAIILLLKDLRDAWLDESMAQKTHLAILGASTEKRKEEAIPLSVLKATRKHASKIGMLLLGLLLGYMIHGQQTRAEYHKQYQQWQQDQMLWEAKYLNVLKERK